MALVLIVDDEYLLLKCLAEYLKARGYDVVTATTCAEALQLCDGATPEVLVTDLGLPDGRAADLIGQISELQRALHVIVISGRDKLPSDIAQHRVDAIVVKPFDPETLVGVIQQSLGKSEWEM